MLCFHFVCQFTGGGGAGPSPPPCTCPISPGLGSMSNVAPLSVRLLRSRKKTVLLLIIFALLHTDGRLTNSNWFVNIYTMGVYDNFFFSSVRIFFPKVDWKKFSHRQLLYNFLRTSQNWLIFRQCVLLLKMIVTKNVVLIHDHPVQ